MNNLYDAKMMQAMRAALMNYYDDNYDIVLVSPSKLDKMQMVATKCLQLLLKMSGRKSDASMLFCSKNNYYLKQMEEFEPLFLSLSDEDSQDRLIELLVFRTFGATRVKLSLNNEAYWKGRKEVEKYKRSEFVEVKNFRCNLSLFDLKDCGYDLKLFFAANGVYVDFILQQYNYNDLVCVKKGDVVIDAGACWGDTALYFSSRGAKAVYSFEFIPSNLSVFEKNISLNPLLKEEIHIVTSPLWSESNIPLSYDDRGPASQVAEAGKFKGNTRTLSIDDLVKEQGLESVDFIKMDIEGAEMPALQGASETIRKFRPKLAISVYHKSDDMIVIPEFIRSLNSDYKFYLDYYTIVGHEIMLYAIDKNAV